MREVLSWRACGLVVLALASPATAGAEPPASPRVQIVSEPWTAPFSAEALAEAVRLRLPGVTVEITPAPVDDGAALRAWSLDRAGPVLRLQGTEGHRVDVPLDLGAPDEARRRAAVLVALLAGAERATPDPPAAATSPPPAPAAAPPPPTTAAPSVSAVVPHAAGRPGAAGPWSFGVGVGAALAVDSAKAAFTTVLRARWAFAGGAAVELGGKLAGGFVERAPDLAATVADRALWVGLSYEPWSAPFGFDVGLALQYTAPALDVDGVGEAEVTDAPAASRFGLRSGVAARWAIHPHLALTAGTAVTLSFAEREFNRAGRDFLELGTTTLDLVGGAEVRF